MTALAATLSSALDWDVWTMKGTVNLTTMEVVLQQSLTAVKGVMDQQLGVIIAVMIMETQTVLAEHHPLLHKYPLRQVLMPHWPETASSKTTFLTRLMNLRSTPLN